MQFPLFPVPHLPVPTRTTAWLTMIVLSGLFHLSLAQADVQTYQQALKSTAWVISKNSEGKSSGTGVLIDTEKRLVVTNAHVVGDSRNAVIFFPVRKNETPVVDRTYYLENVLKIGIPGRILAVDLKRDLALIELSKLPEGAEAIALATKSVGPGETIESIGNPGTSDALWVYTSGTVRSVYKKQFRTSGVDREFRVVETQSPINAGDSGGPVINRAGELVAISQAIATKARLVSYSVDISEVRAFLESPWKKAPLPVTEVLKNAELEYAQDASGHYKVNFPIDIGGSDKTVTQEVLITKDIEYYERADVRKIWSLARIQDEAPSLEMTTRLLQQSARTKLGGWTVEQTSNGKYLIVYVAKLDATSTHDAVKSTMQYVAKLTRSMQRELTPKATTEDAAATLQSWLAE